MNSMELDRYLERIGVPPDKREHLKPDYDTLAQLQQAHLASVPFENLDITQGKVPLALDEASLFDKIVSRRRGGICYELNLLFAAALRALGFNVSLLGGRHPKYGDDMDHLFMLVVFPEDAADAAHQATSIEHLPNCPAQNDSHSPVLPEGAWIADVGFASNFALPLKLELDCLQSDGFDRYRILPAPEVGEGYLRLEKMPGLSGDAEAQETFTFSLRLFEPDDCRERCDWFSTVPESRFTQGPLVTVQDEHGRRTLSGNHFIETRDGMRTSIDVESPEHFAEFLSREFDLYETPAIATNEKNGAHHDR